MFERIPSVGPIRVSRLPNMKTPSYFERLSTGAGLLVLGGGFVSLGALSFIKRHLQDAESGLLLNSTAPIIGGIISILLGFAFFAITLMFIATLLKEENAPSPTSAFWVFWVLFFEGCSPAKPHQIRIDSEKRGSWARKVDRRRNSQPSRIEGSFIDSGTRSRRGDSFEPEVTFCRHETARERQVPASHGSDL